MQQTLQQSTDFPRRITVPVGGHEKGHTVLEDYIWSRRGMVTAARRRETAELVRGVRRTVQLKDREQTLGCTRQHGRQFDAKVFRAHAPPEGSCENFQGCSQTAGPFANSRGQLGDTIFEGLQEQSWLKITDERRRFTEVDTHDSVKVGDLGEEFGGDRGVQARVQHREFPE